MMTTISMPDRPAASIEEAAERFAVRIEELREAVANRPDSSGLYGIERQVSSVMSLAETVTLRGLEMGYAILMGHAFEAKD